MCVDSNIRLMFVIDAAKAIFICLLTSCLFKFSAEAARPKIVQPRTSASQDAYMGWLSNTEGQKLYPSRASAIKGALPPIPETDEVSNPINEIIKQYDAATPESTIKDFQSSVSKLLDDLKKVEDVYLRNDMLREKWQHGITVLSEINSFKLSSSSDDRRSLYNKILDITENGFYDVSNTIIVVDPAMSQLKSLFNDFWQLLLQAREIAAWWICLAPSVNAADVPYLCYKASRMIDHQNEASNVLWAISILGNVSLAISELDQEGDPSAQCIKKAQTSALEMLDRTSAKTPGLRVFFKDLLQNNK